ncbi:ANK_REP_REGION domain-containing protein [Psidium guajava]|nr:ANK_REP_REGION domain-containing protein [Psidium guajava]
MHSLEEKEIWRSRRERIDNALAAVRNTELQDMAEVYAAALPRIKRTIFNADVEEFISVIESLANQIDPSAIFNWRDTDGTALLHFAVSTDNNDILRLLLDYVPDPLLAAQHNIGNTPLHVAIVYNNSRAVVMLIRRIRDLPNIEDKNQILRKANKIGNTALHLAVRCRQVNMVRHMLEEDLELVYLENVEHKSPLYLALELEDPEMHKYLFSLQLEPSRIQGLPPILGAILYNRYGKYLNPFIGNFYVYKKYLVPNPCSNFLA